MNESLLRAIKKEGYTNPTPIQQKSIPIVLQGRDLLGCAQTGTGKTAAFAMPVLQLLSSGGNVARYQGVQPHGKQSQSNTRKIRCLILTPTRELAIQIEESLENYGTYTGLNQLVIFGGVPQHSQTIALRKGVDILVATPGRLLDLINQGYIDLGALEIFVLDEADRMLDMGFVHDVKRILTKIPAKRQSLFFSATMPDEISKLADSILRDPLKVEVTPVSSTAHTIQQSLYYVAKPDKKHLLNHLLEDGSIETVLVFTRTKHGADKVVKDLKKADITAEAIHGNKSQNARQRALGNFKSRQTRVLVATDIAARGIDVDNLTHVINYDLPNIPETYVHRIGRTGRAGASGIAISFCDTEEREFLKDINKLIGKTVPVIAEHPFSKASTGNGSTATPFQQGQQSPKSFDKQPGQHGNRNRNNQGQSNFQGNRNQSHQNKQAKPHNNKPADRASSGQRPAIQRKTQIHSQDQ